MSGAGQHLIDVHDMLRGELSSIQDLTQQVLDGRLGAGAARSSISQMTMRQNDWTLGAYCAAYCRTLTTHHSLEDAEVFPHLRRSDAALEPVIDRLQAEHVIIHTILEDLDAALVVFIRDPNEAAGLQTVVDLLSETLLNHLSYEEQVLVDPLSRYGFYAGQL